jgi:hypothetical protein
LFLALCRHPILSTAASSYISEQYAELREKETESKTLPVTARTLETIIRLSTAIAKCRLSSVIDTEDAEVCLLKTLSPNLNTGCTIDYWELWALIPFALIFNLVKLA